MIDFSKIYASSEGWMNLGYSDSENPFRDHNEAGHVSSCVNLANRLAEASNLSAGDIVIDAGCGYGLQDEHFARMIPGLEIHAVDIGSRQIAVAKRRKESLSDELQRRISYYVADFLRLPFQDGFANKIIALESTQHCSSRAMFFKEAMRVLKPGGTLAACEVLVQRRVSRRPDFAWWNSFLFLLLRKITSHFQAGDLYKENPEENDSDLAGYVEAIKMAGFIDVNIEDISEKIVFWPNRRFAKIVPWFSMLPRPWRYPSSDPFAVVSALSVIECKYLMVSAKKPEV